MPHPPVQRGIRIVEQALKHHDVIDFAIPEPHTVNNLTERIYCADGGNDIRYALALSGEPVIKEVENVIRLDLPVLSINQLWDLQLERTAYQKLMLEAWNNTAAKTRDGNPIDAFIMPIAPYAAVAHGQYGHVSYTSWV
jgi:amidase